MGIRIQGAREHNLRDIDVALGEGLTVVTGVSGSGKSSLVFDTLYHEARRRFLEIYAIGTSATRLAPAQVRAIDGLGPAVAVGQNLLNRNPNSTLATASGLHPFLRLLYANFGQRYCPQCETPIAVLSEDDVVARLMDQAADGADVLAPLFRGVPGSHRTLLAFLREQMSAEAIEADGASWDGRPLPPDPLHSLSIRLGTLDGAVAAYDVRALLERAKALGAAALLLRSDGSEFTLSYAPVCPACGTWLTPLCPTDFHTPCAHCDGQGCDACQSTGLRPRAAAVRWQGLPLTELLAATVDEIRVKLESWDWPASAVRLREEIGRRLKALDKVGLGYVELDRPSPTLSRGEAQRVRLAVTLTSRLEDMLHVLDEPTIGQHPADVLNLLPCFRELAGPVVYVEHDRVAAAAADQAVDLGPGAGPRGGRVLFSGAPRDLWQQDSPTGRYFSLRSRVAAPPRRPAPDAFLTIRGASLRNLQGIEVPLPLGRLTVITGVSGSGKSTLVEDVLVASLRGDEPVGCQDVDGPVLKPMLVDQKPIGRNPRSNPATYTKLSDTIRDLYATASGLTPSHFSFNRPEGACPVCKGMGAVEIKMRYLPSTWIRCGACEGQRFAEEILEATATFDGEELNIADFYELTVEEALPLLREHRLLSDGQRRRARRILWALRDIGLGYLPLGQPSPTLSGGEAQRVKLAKYLGRRSLDTRLLVLDEPTTGLHPQDVGGLLRVLDRLVRHGATVVVVEHNTDVIRAADWIVDLGPGAGPRGGHLLYAGDPDGLLEVDESATAHALGEEEALVEGARTLQADTEQSPPRDQGIDQIAIRGAHVHNLRHVDVDFPKGALTVVTGVSGSGKSSLVGDVLETEARRRFLESLSLYERQGIQEGTEALVDEVRGLGVALAVGPERRLRDRRATVGTAIEISHHLAVLLAWFGDRHCLSCGAQMARRTQQWHCPGCDATAPMARPRHFIATNYAASCKTCNGVGTLPEPNPSKLIIHPEKPLCGGAMYSPGFFPKGYLCKPYNGGYYLVQALAQRYGFDPATTPWEQMSEAAQEAFLFGDSAPLEVTTENRAGDRRTRPQRFPGFYGWIRDWDVGGTYTDTKVCPDCGGARLRPPYLAVTLGGANMAELSEMPLIRLRDHLEGVEISDMKGHVAANNLRIARRRLHFLRQVGLGYLHLERRTATLSAGEAQRIKLAGLLGSGLTSLTVLLDEPTRGLHPSEVGALLGALHALRDEGNTVILVEHDPLCIEAADHVIDMGPGPGVAGGQVVAQGPPDVVRAAETVTGKWLKGERAPTLPREYRQPKGWLRLHGARANNLVGDTIEIPLGCLVGVCGVSGSGKSTLVVDTLGRIVAPKKQTTSVAYEEMEPGAYDAIEGSPKRAIILDQGHKGVTKSGQLSRIAQAPASLVHVNPRGPGAPDDGKGFQGVMHRLQGPRWDQPGHGLFALGGRAL